ncbi:MULTISPECIES: hypothetical protein [unclassified Streptomyces]|uniref:hypothetical protein n=1 Tax=unclassified Streptomyces TaxID=2593676 RepID=UPI001F038291|nr:MULTISPECIES: hypothetical protein [unclassified Streptomyces]MCH0561967.1 hypothetical protein [Streptomyces sp. MUM 2J]MCH0567972.1 hypothetical protein [Streptomyces sp. MUM 136J]
MTVPARLHASTRRDEPPSSDADTGEVRVPIALYALDEHRGDTDLVLSRADADRLLAELAQALGYGVTMPRRSLEAVR